MPCERHSAEPDSRLCRWPLGAGSSRKFQRILESCGVRMTVRVRRGIDIDAGCGQLKAKVVKLDEIA